VFTTKKAIIAGIIFATMPLMALAQGKIAVLSIAEAIINTDYAQVRIKEMRASPDYLKEKKEFDDLKDEGQALVDKFKREKDVMSAEQQAELNKKVQLKREDLEHVARKLQEREKEMQQRLMMEIAPKARAIVEDLIKTEGIGLLLDQQVAMHVDSSYNITPKVTDKLNQAQQK